MPHAGAGPSDQVVSSNQAAKRERDVKMAFRDGVLEQYGSVIFSEIGDNDPISYANSKRPQAVEEAKGLRELDIALGLIPEAEDASTLSLKERKQRSNRLSYHHGAIGNKAVQDCLRDLYVGYELRLTSQQHKKMRLQYENQELKKKLDVLQREVARRRVQYNLLSRELLQSMTHEKRQDGPNSQYYGLPIANAGQESDQHILHSEHDQSTVLEQERRPDLHPYVDSVAQAAQTAKKEEIQSQREGNCSARFNSDGQSEYHTYQRLLTPRHVACNQSAHLGHVAQTAAKTPGGLGSNNRGGQPAYLVLDPPTFRLGSSYPSQNPAYVSLFQPRAEYGERSHRDHGPQRYGSTIRPENQESQAEHGNLQPLFQGLGISPNQVHAQIAFCQDRNSGSDLYQPIHGQSDRAGNPPNALPHYQGEGPFCTQGKRQFSAQGHCQER